jgi:hypothetical protein
MPKSVLSNLFLIFLCIYTTEVKAAELPIKTSTPTIQAPLTQIPYQTLETYHLIQEIVKANIPNIDYKNEILDSKIKTQDEKIKSLEKEIKQLKAPSNDYTATTVLASVSVIITVLGVLIAIISIFGYKNIKEDAIKDARKTAKETIEASAEKGILEATEKSIIKLMNERRFDGIFQDAVEKIAYRGISIPDDIPNEEKDL